MYECSGGGVWGDLLESRKACLLCFRGTTHNQGIWFLAKTKECSYSLILERDSLRCLCTSLFCLYWWSGLFHYSQTSVVPDELKGFHFWNRKTLWSRVEQMGFSEICSQMPNLYKDIHLLSCFLCLFFFCLPRFGRLMVRKCHFHTHTNIFIVIIQCNIKDVRWKAHHVVCWITVCSSVTFCHFPFPLLIK